MKKSEKNHIHTDASLHRCSYKKVFRKYAANLHEKTMPKCDFNKVESNFGKTAFVNMMEGE